MVEVKIEPDNLKCTHCGKAYKLQRFLDSHERKCKGGRPTDYTKDLADRICSEIAEGKSLRKVCDGDDMPHRSTVFRWFRTFPEFRDQYARAKKESADAIAEEILDIADEAIKEVVKYSHEPKLGSAIVQAYKLKSDNLKWTAAKQQPKKYGDKLALVPDDDDPNPLAGLTVEELRNIAGKSSK